MSLLPALTANPRSGTHHLESMNCAALDIRACEKDLSAPEDLRVALSAVGGRELIYGHFRYSEHAAILDEKSLPDLRLIVLTRHPLDRLISRLAFTKALGGELPDLEHSPQRMARDLLLGNWDGKRWPGGLIVEDYAALHSFYLRDLVTDWLCNRHSLLVKFEELIDKPVEVLAGCMAFLGIALSDDDVVRITERINFSTLSGGRSPGEVDLESHYRKGTVGEWAEVFSPTDMDVLRQRCGEEFSKAGYSL